MADFVLFFCSDYYNYYGWRGKFLYDNLTYYDTQVTPYEYHSAYNQNTGIVYVGNNSANQLQGVLGSNHTTQYTYNGNYRPLFVDKDSKVWCVKSSADKYIYLFEADLSDVTIYTLNAGTPLSYLTPTFSSKYVYIMQSALNGVIAKYRMTSLNGGSPTWSINVSYAKCIFCDEDDNLYVLTLGGLAKYSKDDGSQLWSISAGGYYGFYSEKTGMIYVPRDDNHDVAEVTTDGDIDGYSTNLTSFKPACVGGSYNFDIFFMIMQSGVGSTDVIFQYDHSDWDSPESEISHKFDTHLNYMFAGDPLGEVNRMLREYVPVYPCKTGNLYREDLIVKSRIPTKVIDKVDLERLKITEDVKEIEISNTPTGGVFVQKDNDFRITSINTNNKIEINKTNFVVKEVDNDNLSVRPESTTVEFNKKTEDIILNQDIWR